MLKRIQRQSESNARLTVVTGRRRIGKTQLVRHALDGVPYVYLYVGRKTEKELCVSFQRSISEVLGVRLVGEATRLEDLLRVVFEEATSRPITMFIDEFQDFFRRDYEVFSGYSLEQYFQWKFMETTSYTRMGGWWDRKGENEIDLICEDEFRSTLDFYEIKREPRRINLHALQAKGEVFLHAHPEKCKLKCAFQGLSLEDL